MLLNVSFLTLFHKALDNRNPLVIAGKRRTYIRYSIFCWVMPVIIVTVCVLLQLTTTGNATYGENNFLSSLLTNIIWPFMTSLKSPRDGE